MSPNSSASTLPGIALFARRVQNHLLAHVFLYQDIKGRTIIFTRSRAARMPILSNITRDVGYFLTIYYFHDHACIVQDGHRQVWGVMVLSPVMVDPQTYIFPQTLPWEALRRRIGKYCICVSLRHIQITVLPVGHSHTYMVHVRSVGVSIEPTKTCSSYRAFLNSAVISFDIIFPILNINALSIIYVDDNRISIIITHLVLYNTYYRYIIKNRWYAKYGDKNILYSLHMYWPLTGAYLAANTSDLIEKKNGHRTSQGKGLPAWFFHQGQTDVIIHGMFLIGKSGNTFYEMLDYY